MWIWTQQSGSGDFLKLFKNIFKLFFFYFLAKSLFLMFYFSLSLEERVPFLELSGLLEVSLNFFYFHKKCTTFEILGIAVTLSLEMSTVYIHLYFHVLCCLSSSNNILKMQDNIEGISSAVKPFKQMNDFPQVGLSDIWTQDF